MKNLFLPEAVEEIKQRINKLHPETQRQWGKMNVSQMLAHCSATFEVASGEKNIPRVFIGRILGPIFKSHFTNDKPWKKGGPTAPDFIIADERDFEKERSRLLDLVARFASGGSEKVTKAPHAFFGKLSPMEWSTGMYKHLDHHLQQFGV